MPVVQLKNLRMAYQSYGDKSLPTLLLIAGLGMSSGTWPKKLIQLLVQKGLRVVIMDNRDSGDSDHFKSLRNQPSIPMAIGRALLRLPITAPYRLEDMALDLIELLDYLEVPQAHFAGISMGGMIAQVVACVRPSRVKSLIPIMSASGNPRTGMGKLKAIYSLFTIPETVDDPSSLADHYMTIINNLKSPKYEYDEESIRDSLFSAASLPYDPKASDRQLLAILASGDRSEQLKRLNVPTLIMHGEDDPLLPLSASKELSELIPNSRLMVLPLMGHDLPPIHFETITDAIAGHVWSTEN